MWSSQATQTWNTIPEDTYVCYKVDTYIDNVVAFLWDVVYDLDGLIEQ